MKMKMKMKSASVSRLQSLKVVVEQRLTAAVEDIFGHFERTIREFEEELELHHHTLDTHTPEGQRTDVQQLSVIKKEVPPEQQEWSPSLDQEDPEPPHIKEEQEEVRITTFPFTPAPVKSEDDVEEKPQSSQLHQRQTEHMETEADGEKCGGPESARNSDPDTHLTPDTEDKTGNSSDPETDDSDDAWTENSQPQSSLNALNKNEVSVSEGCNTDTKPFSCSECGKSFYHRVHLKIHMRIHTGEKPFCCSVCGKSFARKAHLQNHFRCHTGEKPYSCSVCDKCFAQHVHLQLHMRTHTGEKPFSCSRCNKCFSRCYSLQSHMRIHTGEKPFSCNICDKIFTWRRQLTRHKCGGESSQLH